jgi:hypothetical protein
MAPAEVPVMIGNGLALLVRGAGQPDVGDGFEHANLVGGTCSAAGEQQPGSVWRPGPVWSWAGLWIDPAGGGGRRVR